MPRLTYKKRRLVRLWMDNGCNVTQAGIDAGYSPRTACAAASRVLSEPEVVAYIMRVEKKIDDQLDFDRVDILNEMGRIALADPRAIYDENGSLKPIHELDDDTAASIKSVELVSSTLGRGEATEIEHTHKIQFHAKQASLTDLGKHFNLYEDHQKSGTGDVTIVIEGKDDKA